MPRRKIDNRSLVLSRKLILRLTESDYQQLEKLVGESTTHNLSEAVRKILLKEELVILTRDASMDDTMEELASIRKELKSIGVNINQITRFFNSTQDLNAKQHFAMKVAERYDLVDKHVAGLLDLVSDITLKWLQK